MKHRARPGPLLLLAFLVLAACGASQREKTLSTTFATVAAAEDGFLGWSDAHEGRIVAAARETGDTAAARAELADFRETVDRVMAGFRAAYRVIGAASFSTSTPLSTVADVVARVYADMKAAQGAEVSP